MRIGVISDIHENFHNLFKALEDMDSRGVERILCLGDLINPGIAKVLAHHHLPTHMIWGNNDGEKVEITKCAMRENSKLSVATSTYDFVIQDQKKIFITHYFDLADPMAKSGEFNIVFYGHDHLKAVKSINGCPVVNPGELAASKTGVCSYAIYDTVKDECQLVELDDTITLKSSYSDQKLETYLSEFSDRSQAAYKK